MDIMVVETVIAGLMFVGSVGKSIQLIILEMINGTD